VVPWNHLDVARSAFDLDNPPELPLRLVGGPPLDYRPHDASVGPTKRRCNGLKYDTSGRAHDTPDWRSAWPWRGRVAIDDSSRYALKQRAGVEAQVRMPHQAGGARLLATFHELAFQDHSLHFQPLATARETHRRPHPARRSSRSSRWVS